MRYCLVQRPLRLEHYIRSGSGSTLIGVVDMLNKK